MRTAILVIALGLVLLFGCCGLTNPASSASASPSVSNQTHPRDLNAELLQAAGDGNTELARSLINEGAYVDARYPAAGSWTSLMIASYNGFDDMALMLLLKGANLNLTDDNGRTPLRLATESGHASICRLLLDNGANINSTSISVAWNNETADVLRQYGAK
jgi:ankyrin repeat protein